MHPTASSGAYTLAIDVGGTGLKASVLDAEGRMAAERVRIDTPYPCPPAVMIDALAGLVAPLPPFDRVSVGFPGVIRDGTVLTAPNLGTEAWRGFDLAGALAVRLQRPVRLLNDAEVQGLGAIEGRGLELVVTLGTGVGTGLFRDGELMPHLELAHHPVRKKKTYDDYIGAAALKKVGKRKWNRRVRRVVDTLRALLNYDRIHLGGGNARRIAFELDPDMCIVSNAAGILGGVALWRSDEQNRAAQRAMASTMLGAQPDSPSARTASL